MTNGSNGYKKRRIFTITNILLVVLIVMFHTELFVMGLRLYVSLVDNPRAERLLGDYYQNAARQNVAYSNGFYQNAINKFKFQLDNAQSADNKADIQMRVGRLYECGKGTPTDYGQAKTWYHDAYQSAEAANDEKIKTAAKEAEDRVTQAMSEKTQGQVVCPYQTDVEFLIQSIKGWKDKPPY